ncbi:rod shape-determining protein MreD [Balneola sp. MJW-20]|uniref:rod shape-determining protein MreD n=1 Tax=Gracilimonas aurantiaca TaxID=3234185 RepID=UPI003465BA68
MNSETLKEFLIGLGFVLFQVLIFKHLSLFGAVADPLLIYLLYLSLRFDRTKLILFAGVLGFIQDAFFDFWGLFMFTKVLLCFVSYRFLNRRSEARLLIWQIFAVIFTMTLIHNIIFMILASFMDAYSSGVHPVLFALSGSLYTATVGVFLFIFKGN